MANLTALCGQLVSGFLHFIRHVLFSQSINVDVLKVFSVNSFASKISPVSADFKTGILLMEPINVVSIARLCLCIYAKKWG